LEEDEEDLFNLSFHQGGGMISNNLEPLSPPVLFDDLMRDQED
jgi:hypothetical protein